jgi:hypothetical protein
MQVHPTGGSMTPELAAQLKAAQQTFTIREKKRANNVFSTLSVG